MNTLSPREAAEVAWDVYQLRVQSLSAVQATGSLLGPQGAFAIGSKVSATSGALFRSASGYGYIAAGTGKFQGEMLCVTRGTQTIADWGSNLNTGLQSGPTGRFVHAGFNTIRKSYESQIETYLRGRNPSHIHCVGHSLGGALAMLNADYFLAKKIAPVTLYTFGAPRTGMGAFARWITQEVGADRIFRVSHVADPVPMIPIFPFHHLPVGRPGYMVGAPIGGLRVNVKSHLMPATYLPLTSGKGWEGLAREENDLTKREVDSWMASTQEGSRIVALSASALRMLGRVLGWILKQTANVAIGGISTAGFTVLDRVAGLLQIGWSAGKELRGYIMALIRGIMKFVGRATQETYEVTTNFLRWVLSLLLGTIAQVASSAAAAARSD